MNLLTDKICKKMSPLEELSKKIIDERKQNQSWYDMTLSEITTVE